MDIKHIIKRGLKYIVKGVPNNIVKANIVVSQPDNRLKDRNVLITGGGRGLGYAFAEKCISEGAKVVITGRTEETLRGAAASLGDNCKYIVYDVTNINGVSEMIKKASELLNGEKIDSLISNAGISFHEENFRNVTEEGWDSQMNTNLKGNYFLTSEFIKYLESYDDKKGTIIVITSERSMRPDDIPYGLTKAATNSFIKAFASKVIGKGIRVNGIAPGITCSDMTGRTSENLYSSREKQGRVFMPEEVAEVALFLLTDVSVCINGEIIACDQGKYSVCWGR